MKSSIWNKSFFVAILSISLNAEAKPTLDSEVSQFLNNPSATEKGIQLLPVIVSFQKKQNLFEAPHHPAFHANVQKQMMEDNQKNIEMLINPKNKNAILNLWIASSAVISVSQSELADLSNKDLIASISYAKKSIRLNPEIIKENQTKGVKFTYGLTNLQIPALLAKYPELTGKGMKIGILDTGITPVHPDLKGKILAYRNFSPSTDNNPKDEIGHGTHVAGTMSGGAASGLAIGVAPESKLIVGRIFDGNGATTKEDILKAMQWMADPDGNPNTNDFPVVVNNSWGDDEIYRSKDPQDDPFCSVIDSWIKLGMVPVFAAGNTGPRDETINVPGACPNSLTVGATEQYDRAARFSSTGPTSWKTVRIIKPDISAPGVDVKSANQNGRYENMSGTSMAAPHVSGAIALILQAKPELTVEEVKEVLFKGAKELGNAGKDNKYGFGRVDLLKSVELIKQSSFKK